MPAFVPVGILVLYVALSNEYLIVPVFELPALTKACALPVYVNDLAVGATTLPAALLIVTSNVFSDELL